MARRRDGRNGPKLLRGLRVRVRTGPDRSGAGSEQPRGSNGLRKRSAGSSAAFGGRVTVHSPGHLPRVRSAGEQTAWGTGGSEWRRGLATPHRPNDGWRVGGLEDRFGGTGGRWRPAEERLRMSGRVTAAADRPIVRTWRAIAAADRPIAQARRPIAPIERPIAPVAGPIERYGVIRCQLREAEPLF